MKRKLLSLAITVMLVTSLGMNVSAEGNAGVNNPIQKKKLENIQKISDLNKGKEKIYIRENGQMFVSGILSSANKGSGSASSYALRHLDENKALFGLENVYDNFIVMGEQKDNLGFTHVTLQQTLNGIPIEGKIMVVHYNKEGIVTTINGDVENKITTVNTLGTKNISKEEATNIALKELSYTKTNKVEANKVVKIKNKEAYEVYKVNVGIIAPTIGEWNIYVETHSGNVIEKEDRARSDAAAIGTGTSVTGGTKPLNLYLSGTTYQMKDTTKPMAGQIVTYDCNNTVTEQYKLITNTTSTFNTEAFKAGVDAHYYAGVVFDFYKNLFNRNSIDNKGMSIISSVHYDKDYNNAYWSNGQMTYGDGDGTVFTYLSGDLDVVGHEMTHGVTENTANLNYVNQSGALNESMSDVMGVLIESYDKYNVRNAGTWAFDATDWQVGDQVYTPGTPGDALRSLANPKLYKQPDNMSGYVNTTADHGGVHTNSGIPNKAGFLVAQSLGAAKTAQIYYRGLTTYMTPSTDFATARIALVQAATDLYGASSAEVTATNSAFDSVGVMTPVPFNDPYEVNDTIAQAYAVTSGTVYSSYISSETDVDYCKFTASKGKSISVSLTNLPDDYDLYLCNSAGTQIAKSEKGGTTSEAITYTTTAAGTYYVKVVGYSGANSRATKYALKVTY